MKAHNFPEPDAGVLFPYGAAQDISTVNWLNSKDLQETFGQRQNLTVDSHRRWVESANDTLIWGIRTVDGVHVGNVLLTVTDRHKSAYFQIYIGDRRSRGKGLGQAALSATLALAFGHYGIHRVWLHTFEHNKPAEILYGRNGFVMEGIEREALWLGDGYCSQRRWSLLEPEWRRTHEQGQSQP